MSANDENVALNELLSGSVAEPVRGGNLESSAPMGTGPEDSSAHHNTSEEVSYAA
jgi:hypothetical protein